MVRRILPVTIIGCLLLLGLFTTQPVAADDPENRILPVSGFAPGWVLKGPVKPYAAEDLFEYINGEAELYLQYGFKDLASGFYQKDRDEEQGVSADVYRMASPLEAFGMFANFRRPEAEKVQVGAEGFISPSQLMFFQGAFFVQLNASGTPSQDRKTFLGLAEKISGNLPPSSGSPPELDLLNIPALISRTEKYIPRSVLGYPFFNNGLTAQALLAGRPVRIFVLLESSVEEARNSAQAYEKALKEKGIALKKEKGADGEILYALDPLYGGLCLQARGKFVLGVADLPDPTQGLPLIQQLQKRFPYGSLLGHPRQGATEISEVSDFRKTAYSGFLQISGSVSRPISPKTNRL